MPTHTWTFDAPSGTYKSHAMSRELFMAAVEESTFMDHVGTENAFGRKQGESVTLTRVANIAEPGDATLNENERIPEDSFSLATTSITVDELGRAVPYTSLSDDLSEFDLENAVQRKLTDTMRLIIDTKAAAAFKTTLIKYVPTGAASSTVTTNGTAGAQATENMNVFHVEEIRDYLYDTLACPMIGDSYVGIFRTKGIRGIKRDPLWEEWHKYTDPQAKYNSEVGRIEQTRFIETNHATALPTAGASSILGTGVIFGQDAVVMAEAMTPELRAAQPQDFGRSKAVAWYGILAFGLPFPTANKGEARIVHVTST